MKLASEASKLLTNKYFLYFMVFLSASNVLGYLVTHKLRAVAFFGLVGFLTYQFSKNMSIVLLVALIATNFMMSSRMLREGLENEKESSVLEKVESKDPEIAATLPIVKKAKTNEEAKENIKLVAAAKKSGASETVNAALSDVNNTDLNQTTEEAGAPEGFGTNNSSKSKKKTEAFGQPRLDYAATIEQSYQNLDSVLGSDSIKQLTNDTRQLMAQQQTLFNTMNQMVPVLEGAQSMLEKFDVAGISDSLKSMSSMGKAPTIASNKR